MGYRPVRWKPSRARLKELISICCGNIAMIAQKTGYKPRTVKTWLKEYPDIKQAQEFAAAKAKLNAQLRHQHKALIPPADARRLLSTYYHKIEHLNPAELKLWEQEEEIARVNNLVAHEGQLLVRSKSPGQGERMAPSTGQTLQVLLSWADVRQIVEQFRQTIAHGHQGWHDYVLRVWCGAFKPISDPDSLHEYANLPEPGFDETLESVRALLLAIEDYL
ncbi:MAG: hypothetical protein IGS03_00575 [Candidatus Sericytochromatia bacterium]|nr:hypothetical protein [Candidatus Sericytochromatia bacterium]